MNAAIANLEALINDYSSDILADDAIYNLALIYDSENDASLAPDFIKSRHKITEESDGGDE